MSDPDDPFGLSNDAGRTRIRPVKSGTPVTTPQPPTFGAERPAPPPQQPYGGQSYGGQPYGGQSYGQGYNQPFGTPPDPGQRAPKPRLTRANPNPLIVAFASLLAYTFHVPALPEGYDGIRRCSQILPDLLAERPYVCLVGLQQSAVSPEDIAGVASVP